MRDEQHERAGKLAQERIARMTELEKHQYAVKIALLKARARNNAARRGFTG